MTNYADRLTREETDRQTADAARVAARIIEKKGKATGEFEDNLGRVCTYEAARRATLKRPLVVRNALLGRLDAKTNNDVVAWSDLSSTTATDIAKLFLLVADEAEVGT